MKKHAIAAQVAKLLADGQAENAAEKTVGFFKADSIKKIDFFRDAASGIVNSANPFENANLFAHGIRELAAEGIFSPQQFSHYLQIVAEVMRSAGITAYWHKNGKAGPGAVAAFHAHQCPLELKKQEQAEKAAAYAAKKAELKALEAAAKEAEKAGQHEKQAAAMQVAATVRQAVETTEKENQAEKQAKAEKAQADAVADWMEVGIQLLIQGKIDQHTWDAMQDAALARMLAAQEAKIADPIHVQDAEDPTFWHYAHHAA